MQIDIPQSEQQRLVLHPAEAGYSDVQLYVTEHVLALAKQPSAAESPDFSPNELATSLAMIDRSMAEFETGGGLSIEEARQRSREHFQQLTE